MASKIWKVWERRIAHFFGTRRTPLSGGNSSHTRSDTLHSDFYVEVKMRAKHTAITLWRDTAKKAKEEKKIPVCCLAEKGKQGFWLLVHSDDLPGLCEYFQKSTKKQSKPTNNQDWKAENIPSMEYNVSSDIGVVKKISTT